MKLYKIVMGEGATPHLDLQAKIQELLNKGSSLVGRPFYDATSAHFFQAVVTRTVQSCRVVNLMAAATSEFRIVKLVGGDWVEVTPYNTLQANTPLTVDFLPMIDSGALQNGAECMIQWQYIIYGFSNQNNRPGLGSFFVGTSEHGETPLIAESRIVVEHGGNPQEPYPRMTQIEFKEI